MKVSFSFALTKSQKEAYKAAHDVNIKYLTLVWSRQSGKSTLMKILCIEYLFMKKRQIAYVCRNYILAKRIYKDLIQYIPKEYIKSTNGSDLTIESIFGSTLTLYSAESGASLRGLTFHYLICDEFAFFKQEQTDGTHLWNDILFPTVKVNGIKTIFVSTPLGKKNTFYEMYKKGKDSRYPKYKSILKTIYDDGLIDEEGINDIKKQIPKLSFEQEFECKFLDSSVTFFSGFERCFKKFSNHQYNKCWIGVDLSGDGKDDTILTKINENSEVEQFKICGTLDEKYAQIADIINKTSELQLCLVETNGLGAPMYNEIKKLVKNKQRISPWTTTNSSKEEILSDLAVKIANREIWFDMKDKELFSQFGTFITKVTKTKKLQFEARSGFHDDRIMSLAIALKAKMKAREVYTKDNFAIIDFGNTNYQLV